ncbi:MAG: hypothetical protein DWQ02_02425 [Bacteroidetes bacterium]|nr:MAG: hypothetical protein DWQ02_02425 [Bacteroidota bacterium]
MKSFILSLIFLASLFFACQESNQQVVEQWDNGKPKKTRQYEKAHSQEANYFDNGEIESEGMIVDEKKEKLWTYYFPSGGIKQEIYYREGKPFEKAKFFYENGNIKTQAEYDGLGMKSGLWITYSREGQIFSKGNYSHGKKAGQWQYYNEAGGLEREEFLDEIGRSKYESIYNDDGSLSRYVEYYFPSGLKIEFHRVDTLSNKLLYRSYFENGQIEQEGEMLSNREIGKWTFWYPNGVKKAEGMFLEDLDALRYSGVTEIDPDVASKLPLKKIFKGIMVGDWLYWNKEGRKVAEIKSKIKQGEVFKEVVYFDENRLD